MLRFFLFLFLAASCFAQEKPLTPAEYHQRGVQKFKAGQIKEAIADFDKFIELKPDQEPYHWQRGIAYYYADEYAKGRRQFELHQKVNPNDVENAVWHFMCVAREKSFEQARANLMPISGDTRIPMAEIYGLFAGKLQPADVLKAAEKTTNSTDPLFYAHLYLGLYEEALGHSAESLEHIKKAAGEYAQPHYMGAVAKVHLKLRTSQRQK